MLGIAGFGDGRLLIACWQLDMLAVSWGQIGLSEPLDWYESDASVVH
jgi:hypothetical protein